MNIPPSEADLLDLPTYESVLAEWNEMHDREGEVDAPDPDVAMAILEAANRNPVLIN